MKEKLKIINIKQIERLKYLKGFEIEYLNKVGKPKYWELVSRQGLSRLEEEIYGGKVYSDGAMIFATNYERTHVVMLREFRVSAGHYIYMLPAGLADYDEGVEVTSCREFKEETGMTFEFVSKAPPRFASVGIINERVEIAFGYYSGTPSSDYQSDDEDAEVVLVDRNMAKHILENEDVAIRSALLLENFFGLNPFINGTVNHDGGCQNE